MAKKLSTADILNAARAQAGQAGDAPSPPAQQPSAEQAPTAPAGAEPPTAAEKPAAPAKRAAGAAPKSTKDILAAARAQTGAGAAAPSLPATPMAAGGAKSTKDILAAARAQSASGAAPAAGAKSTGDILAAARAQAGKGAAPEAPATPKPAGAKAAPKAAPAVSAAAAVGGARPSVQEMLIAAREGRAAGVAAAAPAAAVAVKPAPAAPVIPKKPAPAAKQAAVNEPRRGFFVGFGYPFWVLFGTPMRTAWTAFTASTALGGLATARFMMPNVLVEPPSKFKVGPASDYPPAAVSTKWTAQYGVWLVHNEYKGKDIIYALADRVYALGMHAELARRGAQIQVSLSRFWFLHHGRQLRGARSATARADGDPSGGRRRAGSRQEPQIPARTRPMERSGEFRGGCVKVAIRRATNGKQGTGTSQARSQSPY